MAENKKLKIKLVRSFIGASDKQIRVVRALGLTKRTQTVVHENTPVIMGMIKAVPHMLEVTEA